MRDVALIADIHCALCESTGSAAISACQALSPGKIWQWVPGSTSIPDADAGATGCLVALGFGVGRADGVLVARGAGAAAEWVTTGAAGAREEFLAAGRDAAELETAGLDAAEVDAAALVATGDSLAPVELEIATPDAALVVAPGEVAGVAAG